MSDRQETEKASDQSLACPGDGEADVEDVYPHPTRPAMTAIMRGNSKTDTKPEVALRSALHRAGARFRKNYSIRVDGGRPIVIDIAFPGKKLAVFVDGCFWHVCPEHGTRPKSNKSYWGPKLAGNVERDRTTSSRLRAAGWDVIRVWEHEPIPGTLAEVFRRLERN